MAPAGTRVTPTPAGKGKAGRKPSPATAALIEAMRADSAARRQRSRVDYLRILRDAGHAGSEASAAIIVAREAKRAFGRTLGRSGGERASGKGRGAGKPASAMTVLLRERLAADKAKSQLRDAGHYTRWAIDQPGHKMGLKQVRPIVYRELRAAR